MENFYLISERTRNYLEPNLGIKGLTKPLPGTIGQKVPTLNPT